MELYHIEFSSQARHEFSSLSGVILQRIDQKILALANNPRPPGVKKLKGYANRWRIRVGNYRVIYKIEDDRLIILVIQISHRSDAYT